MAMSPPSLHACTTLKPIMSLMQVPQSVAAAAAAPAGLPQLPARPAAGKATADAAASRANAASLATSNGTAHSNLSVVNNGPAIKQAAGEIAEAAGLVMADAGVPQTSGQSVNGQTGKEPLHQSQAVNGNGLAGVKPGANGLPKTTPKNAVPAASAKDVSVVSLMWDCTSFLFPVIQLV